MNVLRLFVSTSTLFLLRSALKMEPKMVPAINNVGRAICVGSGSSSSSSSPDDIKLLPSLKEPSLFPCVTLETDPRSLLLMDELSSSPSILP